MTAATRPTIRDVLARLSGRAATFRSVGVRLDPEAEIELEFVEAFGEAGDQAAHLGRGGVRGGLVEFESLQRLQPYPADNARRVDQARRGHPERVFHGLGPARYQGHAPAVGDHGLTAIIQRRWPPDVQVGAALGGHGATEDDADHIGGGGRGRLVVPQQPPGQPAAGEDALVNVLPEGQRTAGLGHDAAEPRAQPVQQGDVTNPYSRPFAPGGIQVVGNIIGGRLGVELDVEQEQAVVARRGGQACGDAAHAGSRPLSRDVKEGRIDPFQRCDLRQQAAGRLDVAREPAQVERAGQRVQ